MNVRAQAKYVRQSPTKVRQVLDLVRGLPAEDARIALHLTNRKAALVVGKVLDSAIANAQHNFALDPDELVVSEAFADEGPTLKRFRPRARGRATRVRKRTCHVTIVLAEEETE